MDLEEASRAPSWRKPALCASKSRRHQPDPQSRAVPDDTIIITITITITIIVIITIIIIITISIIFDSKHHHPHDEPTDMNNLGHKSESDGNSRSREFP